MRTLRLLRVAAEAEGLRLRHMARRTAVRAALGVIGLAFLIGAVVFAHIAAWYWLRLTWAEWPTALMLAAADIVLAAALALLVARSSPGPIETEALAVRQRAWESATGTAPLPAILLELLRLVNHLLSRARP